jgi:hypothetical protein
MLPKDLLLPDPPPASTTSRSSRSVTATDSILALDMVLEGCRTIRTLASSKPEVIANAPAAATAPTAGAS